MTDFAVGDRVLVVRPDPEHGIGCICAGYDAAYRVVKVEPERRQLWAETRLPFLRDPIAFGFDEVEKTERPPHWDTRLDLWSE